MQRVCQQCQSEMISDCELTVEHNFYGIKISQKRAGLFNNVSVKPKAAVCPTCGYVALYVENLSKFQQ